MTTEDWGRVRLGDCIHLSSGGTPSKKHDEYWGGEIPWVSPKDLKVVRLYDSEDHVTAVGLENGTRLAEQGSILIMVRGMGLANEFPVVRAMRDVAFNQDLKAIVPAGDHIDGDFLFYLLRAEAENLRALADEAAHGTKRIQTDRLLDFEINLPPIHAQRTIADAASAYDDLIENNHRRIDILDEQARALYREWFVNLRFPGQEQLEMVESELGPVPEGWSVAPMSSFVALERQSVKPNRHPTDLFAHFSIPAFDAGQRPFNELGENIKSGKYAVPEGAILVSKLNPRIPRVWRVRPSADFVSVCSTEFLVLLSQEPSRSFLFGMMAYSGLMNRMSGRAGGTSTSHQRVRPSEFMKMKVIVPPVELTYDYERVVQPMLDLIDNLRDKNEVLRATHDLLLPKLVSGEIDMRNLKRAPKAAVV